MGRGSNSRERANYFICIECGIRFQYPPSSKAKFCSRQCYSINRKKTPSLQKLHKRLHCIWMDMRARCRGTSGEIGRKYYYSRGIRVCEEWNDFSVFCSWALANGYRDDLEIDRIDNDAGYNPENCRWATRCQQMANTRVRKQRNKTSRFRGVQRLNPKKNKTNPWRAMASENGKPRHLGVFATEELAARAYDAWAKEVYGEFASTNFKDDESKEKVLSF